MIYLNKKLYLTNYTMILPSVAVGNVAQLSIDLLISTLSLRKIGCIFDTCFIPLVGADPYNKTNQEICTSVDLYLSDEKKLVVLQIRTPLVKKAKKFFYEILNFVKDYKILKVIILTSCFGHDKRDEQIRTVPFCYLTTKNISKEFKQQFEELSWKGLESSFLEDSNKTIWQIHGGGFAQMIFELLQENNIISVVLFKFCSEGNNIPDAVELINCLNCWLQLFKIDSKFKFPPSWNFVFGKSTPKEIY
ncbi:PREDICTED: proteasome assembly chaperone 2 [Ceratosolen solmsi marchali]|uniref:Proteasome assembly chaperone 2 n=1 Tax=Ceratosolen solmsi marchali TaxID=326594 RepID=A0AAJ7DUN9_9HYME|nr:PREDICTED: proteasome assembly chaperone 2 [Ceratosolen solmsi marchali]